MGLLKSFNNGTQTDLTQKKFGSDRPGRGSSNQPYIQATVDRTIARGSSTDTIVRGGLSASTTALEDANRLADLLFDNKSPTGFLFVSKQRLLSKISPKTPASFGSGYTGGAVNQGVYSPLSTIEQARRGFSGFHTEKFGLFLGAGLNRYDQVVQGKSNNGVPSDSRVFGLQQALFTENGAPEGTLDVFKVSDNPDTPVVLEYKGGPGSTNGEGNTLLKYSTTPLGNKTTVNIKTEGTYFKNSFDLEPPNFTTPINLTDKISGEGLLFINENRYFAGEDFNIENTFNLRGNSTNKWGLGTNVNPKAATTVVGGILSSNIKIENTLFTPLPDPTEDLLYNAPRDVSDKTSKISSVDQLYTRFFVNSNEDSVIRKFGGPEGNKFGISNILINKSTSQTGAPLNTNISLEGTFYESPVLLEDVNFTTPQNLTNKTSFLSLKDLYDEKIQPGKSYTNVYNLSGNNTGVWGLSSGLNLNLATTPSGAPSTVLTLKSDAGDYYINPSSINSINTTYEITSTGENTDNNTNRLKQLYENKDYNNATIRRYTINKNIEGSFSFYNDNRISVGTNNNNAPIILPNVENNSFKPSIRESIPSSDESGKPSFENTILTSTNFIELYYDALVNDGAENEGNRTIADAPDFRSATDNKNSPTGVRTVNSKYNQQLTANQIKEKANVPPTENNYPSSIPVIKDDFRKEVQVFNAYASTYTSGTGKLDSRVQQGSPGGSDSKVVNPNARQSPFKPFSGLSSNDKLDKINASTIYKAENASSLNDLVNFRIGIIDNDNPRQKDYIHFRAFLNDIDDKYSSAWDSIEYVGRSELFYNYKGGFERTISTSWTVAAQSKGELLPMYQKLNFLASTLAGDYSQAGYNRGNLSTLTIGDYVVEQPGFFKSISYKMKQGNAWEIGIDGNGTATGPQLCHIIEVSNFEFTCIHDFRPQKQLNQFDSGRAFILNNPSTNYISQTYG